MTSPRPITVNNPGDAHELTFSCYKRLPLLSSDDAKRVMLSNIEKARKKHDFEVWAYVIMPEHVHLLIHPRQPTYRIDDIRKNMKQQTAKTLLSIIRGRDPATAKKLIIPSGETRFWQKGKGFDRNMFSPKAIHASINYIHANPVRRGLCQNELDYPWSSARFYAEVVEVAFPVDRCTVVKMV